MKNIRVFLSENFHFFEVKFSIYLNRRVFVMFAFRYILYCGSKLTTPEPYMSGAIRQICFLFLQENMLWYSLETSRRGASKSTNTFSLRTQKHRFSQKKRAHALVLYNMLIYSYYKWTAKTLIRIDFSGVLHLELYIRKTYLYNFDPLKPHFHKVKLGFTGVYIIFLISAQEHRLWVLVRTATARRF